VIIEDVELEGTLTTHESVVIGGNLKGQINSSSVVWILKGANIEGDINANGLIVEGYVRGNVLCSGKAELRSGAQIKGDVACATLAISKGCALEGKVKMLEGKLQTFVAKRKMADNTGHF
jgi:cytoskeletal protein CcmA (bactofilin family)